LELDSSCVGRLENIIERNQRPGKSRIRRGLGVGFAMIVVFVVLILLIFTDLATPPEDERLAPEPAARPAPNQPRPVRGLKLWSPAARGGSGSGSGSSPRAGSASR